MRRLILSGGRFISGSVGNDTDENGENYLDAAGAAFIFVQDVFGCLDPLACNYHPLANFDDRSCEYDSCICTEDINQNGFVDNADLVLLLGNFGCTGELCYGDVTGRYGRKQR